MRIILYTGKGGVGKTSVAAATALRCAELGHRTIALSTDAAHSLSDSFDTTLGPEPVEIAPNLWGQEVDVYYSIEKHWATLQRSLTLLTRRSCSFRGKPTAWRRIKTAAMYSLFLCPLPQKKTSRSCAPATS